MDEKETTEKVKPDNTEKDTGERDKSKAVNLVEGANLAAERMEAANAKAEELVARQEEAAAKMILGGQAEAGQAHVKPEEISDEEYANQVMKGEVKK